MTNVFDFLKPKASLNRNGFDLSQRHVYSQKAGMIVPVLALDCIPQDYHEIELLSLCRTLPLETDAFTRLKVSFNFGFVPYQQLWHRWDEFILQTEERFSVLDSGSLPLTCPNIRLAYLLEDILTMMNYDRLYQYMVANFSTLTADQKAYLMQILPIRSDVYDAFNVPKWRNAIRLLDMLGYGGYYQGYKNLFGTPVYWKNTTGNVSEDFDKTYNSAATNMTNHWESYYGQTSVNLFRLMAYHKFCQDYFRSTQFEPLDPALFNMDDPNEDFNSRMLYALHYALYKKDIFTGLYATPQFGSVSSVDLGTFNLHTTVSNPNNLANTNVLSIDQSNGLVGIRREAGGAKVGNSNNFVSSASIDVYELKKAEMFQKWKEDKLRAGNKLRNQSIAQWGDSFRYLQDNYSDYIKEITMNISIDEVTNMSAQGDIALGELAGKAVGTTNGKVTYKCSDFGVLLCVAYIQPVAEYDALGLDKNNTLIEPFDFATPAFENLGLEAVYSYQLSAGLGSGASGVTHENLVKTLGFAPRYLNYKTAVDKVHGEFMSTGRGGDTVSGLPGSLSHWVTPRRDMEAVVLSQGSIPLEFLKINPSVLDTIFVTNADGKEDTDQFLFNSNFVIKSVRGLSILGLPRW